MRTPASCGICGVMGHTRRVCRIARLRRLRERDGGPVPTREEEERVAAELRQEFQESRAGILWATHQREWAERREQAVQRNREAIQEGMRERQRQREAEVLARGLPRPEPTPIVDAAHSFSQIISWARRAEREVRSQIREVRSPKALSLKMVSDFQENYTVDTECSICYDSMPNIGLPCKHTFCGECTVKFAKKAQTCPLCRCSFEEAHICRNIEPEEFNKISAKLYL
tara:strand:- start:158 stop:841 length:684 start_codon:yes stop_codon:yes gene_type:complete